MCTCIRINMYMYTCTQSFVRRRFRISENPDIAAEGCGGQDFGVRRFIWRCVPYNWLYIHVPYNWLYIHIHIHIYTYMYTYICMYVCVCIEQIPKFWKPIASGWCEGQGGGLWCCVPRHVNVYIWSRNSESHKFMLESYVWDGQHRRHSQIPNLAVWWCWHLACGMRMRVMLFRVRFR